MTMNEDIKAVWLAELRNPDNRQGSGKLTRFANGQETNCCLGLLCKIAVERGLDIEVVTRNYPTNANSAYVSYNGEEGVLPGAVRQWAGMDSNNPIISDAVYGNSSLAEFNDNGRNFLEIADIIERNL